MVSYEVFYTVTVDVCALSQGKKGRLMKLGYFLSCSTVGYKIRSHTRTAGSFF